MKLLCFRFFCLFATAAAIPSSLEDFQLVNLTDYAHGGSGCVQGDTTRIFYHKNTETIVYKQFSLTLPNSPDAYTAFETCGVVQNLYTPSGYRMRVRSFVLRGYAHLDAGASLALGGYIYNGEDHNKPEVQSLRFSSHCAS
jgi:hypothetical protein